MPNRVRSFKTIVVTLFSAVVLASCGLGGGGGGGNGDGGGGGNGGGAQSTTTLRTTTTSFRRNTTTTFARATTTTIGGGPGTTIGGPTTTTIGVPGQCPSKNRVLCATTFRVTNNVVLGALQFAVDYGDANGCFKGQGADVACVTPPGINALTTFNDKDSEEQMVAAFVSVDGIDAPADVAQCDFIASRSAPAENDFSIDVIESVAPDNRPRVANVDVVVSCSGGGGGGTTTTTGGGGPTTTTGGGGPTTTNAPTTSSTLGERDTQFDVVLGLQDAVQIGSLQVLVDYTAAPGEFRGSGAAKGDGGTLICTALVPGVLTQFNDDDAGHLTVAFVSLNGFSGPVNLASCVFDRDGFGTLSRNQFSVTIDSATDPEVNPIDPLPNVGIVRVTPR